MINSNALDAIRDFISSCAFIHDDPDDASGVDWDQHGTNPFLLSCAVCVLDSTQGFGEAYLDYLHTIDVLPKHLIVPEHHSGFLVDSLLHDPVALAELKKLVTDKRLDISTFYPYKHQDFTTLLEYLKNDSHSPKCHPAEGPFYELNDKIRARQFLERLGIPVPEGTICYSLNELHEFYNKTKSRFPRILVKKYHWDISTIDNATDIDKIAPSLRFPIVAEAFYPVKFSPISHNLVWRGQSHLLFIVTQAIQNNRHSGNYTPTTLSENITKQIMEYSYLITSATCDFTGVIGIDFILTDGDELLAVDINPRFNSSTYPFYFLINKGYDLLTTYARYGFRNCEVADLSEIFLCDRFIPFNLTKNEGILLYTPTFNREKEKVTKVSYLCIAKSQEYLSYLQILLHDILSSISMT